MKLIILLSLSIISLGANAWSNVKNPFEFVTIPHPVHPITDCMFVASEAGDYIYKKLASSPALHHRSIDTDNENENEHKIIKNPMEVCGLYIIGEPDTTVEITMKYMDVNCETGGLMAFVDGWELNGEYFPGIKDHQKTIEERTDEFCNDYNQWPLLAHKKNFRSSQNAALLQYRIPLRGSFIANVKFHKISEPCNIMVQDTSSIYHLNNFGHNQNCTLTALFPAVISVLNVKIGNTFEGATTENTKVNYECYGSTDHLEMGGSIGLESVNMEKSSDLCGMSQAPGPEQAIFCGVTSMRLISSGKFRNTVGLTIRQADENDLELATLVCPL